MIRQQKGLPSLLLVLVVCSMAHADQLLENCTSSEVQSSGQIEGLLAKSIKDKREDCIKALLSNSDFNNRGVMQLSLGRLPNSDQRFVLEVALATTEAWIEPLKNGEEIASFRVMTERYVELFKLNNIHTSNEQLLSEIGRTNLLKLVRGSQSGDNSQPSVEHVQHASKTEHASAPPTRLPAPKKTPAPQPTTSMAKEEPASSTLRRIIVVLIVAGCGLLWWFLKRCP